MDVVVWLLTAFVLGILISCYLLYLHHGRGVEYLGTERLDGKTAIITGGSGAIGKNIAINLAKRGAKVIIASRDLDRGHYAVQEIQHSSKNFNIQWLYLDLSNLLSVRQFASHFIQSGEKVHILINNAGVAYVDLKHYRTKDGYDTVFLINYLGHFLLTYLLMDVLKSSAPARIVNVSSTAHTFVLSGMKFKVTLEEKYGDVLFPYFRGYDSSKLAMVLHVKELTRRLAESGVTSYAVHPGVVIETGIWLNMEYFWPKIIAKIARTLLRLILRMDAVSASQTPVYCAVAKDLNGISGKYYYKCKEAKESASAKDEKQAKLLWYASMILTGCMDNGNMVSLNFFEDQLSSDRDTTLQNIYKATKKPEEKLHPMQRA